MSKKSKKVALPQFEVFVEGFVMPSILVDAATSKDAIKVATDLVKADYPKAVVKKAVKK